MLKFDKLKTKYYDSYAFITSLINVLGLHLLIVYAKYMPF